MRKRTRTVVGVGLLGPAILGFVPLAWGNGLEQVTARQIASDDHPRVPAITVERLRECVAEYGGRLEPQNYRFSPRVQVDQDGITQGVSMEDTPEATSDLAACVRVTLRDMAIPTRILGLQQPDAVAATNESTLAHRSYMGSPAVVVVVAVGLSELVLEAGAYTILMAITVEVVGKATKEVAEALKRRRWMKECLAHYEACVGTPVSGQDGNHWSQTRCGVCLERCTTSESWPSRVGNGSCEYWGREWGP